MSEKMNTSPRKPYIPSYDAEGRAVSSIPGMTNHAGKAMDQCPSESGHDHGEKRK